MTPQQLLASAAQLDDQLELDEEMSAIEVDISHLEIEDDTPVDNFKSEEQQRLLVEPLYSSKVLPMPFLAAANVGLFYKLKGDPIVPDVLLSKGVQRAEDYRDRRNRSYFAWEFGKVPDVCIEIVSNTEGDELLLSRKSQQRGKSTSKKEIYAQIGVPYYVVFDPLEQIADAEQMAGAQLKVFELRGKHYVELSEPFWMDDVGLGLVLWDGTFEEVSSQWLRWCDRQGQVIPTGAERAEVEQQRAEQAETQLDAERQRADAERQRADAERQRAEQLAERLRALGINPDGG